MKRNFFFKKEPIGKVWYIAQPDEERIVGDPYMSQPRSAWKGKWVGCPHLTGERAWWCVRKVWEKWILLNNETTD